MNKEEMNKVFSKVIAKAWADEDFKKKLKDSPEETLKAEGIELPSGIRVNVLENTEEEYNLVIPSKPTELSDDELDQVAGGMGTYRNCLPCVGLDTTRATGM